MKNELTTLIRFRSGERNNLFELFSLLGYDPRINTCLLVESRTGHKETLPTITMYETLQSTIVPVFTDEYGQQGVLSFPVGRASVAVCFPLRGDETARRTQAVLLAERVLQSIQQRVKGEVFIGIGKSGADASYLPESYSEAVMAQAYASFFRNTPIVHVDDVRDPSSRDLDQLFDLNDFSVSIKTGNLPRALEQFDHYFSGLLRISDGSYELVNMRALHLITQLLNSAMSVGIPGATLVESSNRWYTDLLGLEDSHRVREYLTKVIEEIVSAISLAQKHKMSKVVIKARGFIEAHCTEPITSTDIAEHVAMSQSYLSYSFKKETGITLTDYVSLCRIAEAKKLLSDKNLSITEVAYRCGFNDSNYFSTAFKKSTSLSPTAYRKTLKS